MPSGIVTVDTQYLAPGIAASHLVVDNGRAAFIDCGTASSLPLLLAALEQQGLGPAQVDWVCPTHVHLDHAGGAGQLMAACPGATCVAHPRAARHLIDPTRLIEGSLQVYGEARFKALYGEVLPIDAGRVRVVEDGERLKLGGRDFEFIHTEGHARHHYCVIDRQASAIFSGDTLGASYRHFDNNGTPFVFAPTTPVQFDPPAWHASLERIRSYGLGSAWLTHFGQVTELSSLFEQLKRCIDDLAAMAEQLATSSDRNQRLKSAIFDWFCQRLDEHGDATPAEQRRTLLQMDVELNAMGLEVWLERQR